MKVATLLGLLVAVSLVRRLPVLLAAYTATLILAAASKLSLSSFVTRVWLFVPIFTGLVVAPAALNVVTPGHVVVPLGTWFGHHLGLTAQGLGGGALIIVRVATSISLVVLLTLTTPWTKLLAALRGLFVPRLFVQVLAMAYRYLFHLLATVEDMYVARRARTVTDRDVATGRAFVAATAGAVFGRSQALAEEVHLAMVARGYDGDAHTLSSMRVRLIDVAWLAAAVATAVALVGLGR
jgi:cobalt/nickel transport system permease protein